LRFVVTARNQKQDLEESLSDSKVVELSDLDGFLAARDFLLDAGSYQEAKAGFRWPQLTKFNWALDYFDTLAERCVNPGLVYVDDQGVEKRVSFRQLTEGSNKVANFFGSMGLGKRDRVMLMLPNCVELFEVFLGAMKAGCVIIPASTLLTPDDVRDRMQRGKVKCVFTTDELSSRVDQAASPLPNSVFRISLGAERKGWLRYSEVDKQSPVFKSKEAFSTDDELLIYFTSGTTAKPKLVLHTHASYPVGHLTTMYWIGLRKGDLHYNVSAPGWAKYAWSSIFAVWNAEATTFVYNYSGKFDAKQVLSVIEKHEVNTLCAPPTVWRLLLLEDLRTYHFSLRELVSAGEPLNPEIIQRVRNATGLTIREGFGQSETTLQVGIFPGTEAKLGSMGVEAPGSWISILSDEHLPVPSGSEGMIAIQVKPQGPVGLMTGYIDQPDKNREVFVGEWYLTGDVASRDVDGYFWFIGRADDVFKSSDYRISAFELESELMAHQAVAEVAVVASPDSLRGFVPKAYVNLKPNMTASRELAFEIFRFIRDRVAPYKRPRIIQFTEELPKTVSGKIRRTDLRNYESELRGRNVRAKDEYFESDFQIELKASGR